MRLRITALAALAAVMASPASAQELWNGYYAGEPFSEVAALNPEKVPHPKKAGKMKRVAQYWDEDKITAYDVQLTPDCVSTTEFRFRKGLLYEVSHKTWSAACTHEAMRALLVQKYGQPLSVERETKEAVFLKPLGFYATYDRASWIYEGITIGLVDTTVTYSATGATGTL